MHRWTARFLLLIMLVPAFGPLALARATAPEAMHCARHPLDQSSHAAEPGMPCHHGMAMAPPPESPATSFSAVNSCCDDHNCCRGMKTSEWARPAGAVLKLASLQIEPAVPQQPAARASADLVEQDAARAPPRG